MIDAAHVQRWLDAYVDAWLTYEPAAIGALFTDDAEYRWHPWDTGDGVASGRDAIVAAWLDERDVAGTYEGEYAPLLVAGENAVATGVTRYYAGAGRETVEKEFHNLWVLRFAGNGQCSSFTEWYMRSPSRPGPGPRQDHLM